MYSCSAAASPHKRPQASRSYPGASPRAKVRALFRAMPSATSGCSRSLHRAPAESQSPGLCFLNLVPVTWQDRCVYALVDNFLLSLTPETTMPEIRLSIPGQHRLALPGRGILADTATVVSTYGWPLRGAPVIERVLVDDALNTWESQSPPPRLQPPGEPVAPGLI